MLATVRPNFAPLQAQIPEGIATDISASDSPHPSPTTPSEKRLFPRPLNIFKRPSRQSLVRLTAPVDSIPESIFEAEDTTLVPRPLSITPTPAASPTQLSSNTINIRTFALAPALIPPSIPASATPSVTSPPPSLPTTPSPSLTPLPHTTNATTCTLCASPLIHLQTYTLPKTAPALTSKIHTLYPTIPLTTHAPTFCTACFTTIRALHLCWGCGDRIHRPEERVGCGWAWWHWGCVRCLLCRAPLPPPPWTHAPTTLSVPPSCKPCTRELRELAYAERIRKQTLNPVVVRSTNLRRASNGGVVSTRLTNTRGTSPSTDMDACANVEADTAMSRMVSLGVRYPPLPRWMEKLPGNRRGVGKGGEGREVRWMEKLPGRRQGKGARVGEQVRRMDGWGLELGGRRKVGSTGNGRRGKQRSGSGYGSVRGRIVVG